MLVSKDLKTQPIDGNYNLAQSSGPGYVVVKIRWDELSHIGLDIHKVVLLRYLVNGVINIERCDRVMYKCDGRMHLSGALMHNGIAPSTRWHYTLAQLYRPRYVVANI